MFNINEKKDNIFNTIILIMMTILLFITIYPLYYVIIASFSDPNNVALGQVILFPKGITFEGYRKVFNNLDIWLGYRNTIFYTTAGTVINLSVTLAAAYSLANRRLIGRKAVSFLMLFTMFFSGGLIPTYLLIKSLNMLDTIWVMLIPGAASAYNIFISRTFFTTGMFTELEDAAKIDGCSVFGTFIKIVIPLSSALIAVMALFYGIGHWNSYFNAMIYLSDRGKFPLQVFLREILVLNQMSDANTITAEQAELLSLQARTAELVKYVIIIVATLPVMIIYPFLQKYFVKGVMLGSVKG
jgi:putative aldouronate transport system permease protein